MFFDYFFVAKLQFLMNHLMYYSFFNKLNVQKNEEVEEVEEVEMWKRELKKEEEIQAGQLSW